MNDDAYWEIAREVCAPKQLEYLTLRYKHNKTLLEIAYGCGVSKSTVTSSLARAEQLIALRARGAA